MDNKEQIMQALEKWKEANRQLLHYQEESYFILVELLDSISTDLFSLNYGVVKSHRRSGQWQALLTLRWRPRRG